MFLVMTLTGCGLETIASMPTEPENTAESFSEVEEHPLAPIDEIMSTKGLNKLQRAAESEEENETQDEPEVVAEEETAEETERSDEEYVDPEPEGDSIEHEVLEDVEEDTPINTEPVEPSMHLWGVCTLTFYCGGPCCCGQWAGGPTASGVMPTPNHTVACGDLPFGTRLMIEGQEYVVEDRGVSGMWVDIYVASHDEALQRGMYQSDVYIID